MRNSFVAGAVLAAAQVGVGSGLGVLDWPLSFSAIRGWGQLLTWVAFIFAVGVAGGAVVGRRALRRPRPTLTIWARVAASGASGLGSAAAFPLVWIPVRVNQPTVDLAAEVTMAVTAGIGALVGMVLAVIALSWKPVTSGVVVSAAWVWLFALVSVGLAAKDHVRVTPRLGMIDAPQALASDAWWLGPYLMVGVAALLGLVVAAVAGWKGAGWVGIALSGLAGPGLVASAYLITGWGVSGNGEDLAPYAASLLAVCSGVIASMAVASAAIPHHPPAPPARRAVAPPRPGPRVAAGAAGDHRLRGAGVRTGIVLCGAAVPSAAGVLHRADLPARATPEQRAHPADAIRSGGHAGPDPATGANRGGLLRAAVRGTVRAAVRPETRTPTGGGGARTRTVR